MRARTFCLLYLFCLFYSTIVPFSQFFMTLCGKTKSVAFWIPIFWICLMISLWCHELFPQLLTCVSSNLEVKAKNLIIFKLNMGFLQEYCNGDPEHSLFLQKARNVLGCYVISKATFDHSIVKLVFSLYNDSLISTWAFNWATICGMSMCRALC